MSGISASIGAQARNYVLVIRFECAYDAAKSHMVSCGYWILDGPTLSDYPGAEEAMEDLLIRRDELNSEQVYLHYLFRQP
jgi:hypothetical protein